jgi:hypothetical protein
MIHTEAIKFGFSTSGGGTSGGTSQKIPLEDFSKHITMYPGVQFKEIRPKMRMIIFDGDREAQTAAQGTTPDDIAKVQETYVTEMKSSWQGFRISTGFHGMADKKINTISLHGKRQLPDGKKIGVKVILEKDGTDTLITVVMAPIVSE